MNLVQTTFLAQALEREVMAHRFLYYVRADSRISDEQYDAIERLAWLTCPRGSSVFRIGSSDPDTYSEEDIRYAGTLVHLSDRGQLDYGWLLGLELHRSLNLKASARADSFDSPDPLWT